MKMSTPAAALKFENLLYEKKNGIAYVTVNRPKVLNALNNATWHDLRAAFEDARDDTTVRGIILTGAGDKAFIAGADISELAKVSAVQAEESSSYGQDVLNVIENLGKPVIAAINGFALGGGCETAMACTIRIAVEHAKFGQPEVKLGLVPGGGGTQRLPRLVGKGRALQLILSQLTAILDDVFAAQPMAHWYEVFGSVHVTFGAVRGPQEVIDDPQLRANDIVVPLEGAGGKLTSTISSPIQVHGVAKVPARRAPNLGEHTEE